MITLGPIGFLAPWLLAGLSILPLLWWLLRAIPPAPLRRRFPAVLLLLGLEDKETSPDRTPWWLLLLRMLAVSTAIIAFARPVLNPTDRIPRHGPLLIAMDSSWASAQSWATRQAKLAEVLQYASQDGRPVAVVRLTDKPTADAPLAFADAETATARVDGLQPNAWSPDYAPWVAAVAQAEPFETLWISDGLARAGRAEFYKALSEKGAVSVSETGTVVLVLKSVTINDGMLAFSAARSSDSGERRFKLFVEGTDPTGIARVLARADGAFEEGATEAEIHLELQSELRNRVTRVAIDGIRSAGAVQLADDAIRHRSVALLGGVREQEGAALVSPLHFLRKALAPTADLFEANLADTLQSSPDVIVMADVAGPGEAETQEIVTWVEQGGHLVRFAGPRLVSSGIGQREEHPLLPVRLRPGGRSVGGAMSWGAPKMIEPFGPGSPFFGLKIPADVAVISQVVAQPDPDLAARVLASLADGTPLVTAKDLGNGRVTLFHVTANADWSTLPLSGLFVQMLERLVILSPAGGPDAAEIADTTWVPEKTLDGFGVLRPAAGFAGVDGARLAARDFGADMPPGIYADENRRVAVNAVDADTRIAPVSWPGGTAFVAMTPAEQPLQSWLLRAVLILLAADVIATLWIGGHLRSRGVVAGLALAFALAPMNAQAQAEKDILRAANNTVLAYVLTGDPALDEISDTGLTGLSAELYRRTSIEPITPVGVDAETDELSLYPFLYWPISDTQSPPGAKAVARINAFLRGGGMILFDTRDSNISGGSGAGTPNGRVLQSITRQLDIPPLEPVPHDHVLTRAFYLLQDFPGRYANAPVWVEAAPPNAERIEGMPFRNLNDGVTPVVIGGNDWASAWAIDESGRPIYPVGRGSAGERRREFAFRFGVNLIMHVMTGNYKSDQVHVPALLDRLGQ
ncbi:MAG: DUF4159 domain-containing protein [Rhodobacteraceae bacterium]|nr:DUF4159 domain-containing protein [Paracoccaceae bacterium]